MNSKHLARLAGVLTCAVVALGLTAPLAQGAPPVPPYSQFAGCPTPAENPNLEGCVRSVVVGGHFKMGSKDVPLVNPMPLTGGVAEGLSGFTYNSEGGLKPVKQKVPGGVIGLTGLTWLAEFLGSEALTLYAVTELAGTPQLSFPEITLPVKVHLVNPVLGNNCYVGSSSNPINLHLKLKTPPVAHFDPETVILHLNGAEYVDNTFAAPGASGCTLTLLGFIPVSINGLVNSQSGLPSPSGNNETVQVIDTEVANRSMVYP